MSVPTLPLGTYRFRFRLLSPDGARGLAGANYLGSAWRGALGRVLRSRACTTGMVDCSNCPLVGTCAYPAFFEGRRPDDAVRLTRYPNAPPPYIVDPDYRAEGDSSPVVGLAVTVFGPPWPGIDIVAAAERAGRTGLTNRRIGLRLEAVEYDERSGSRILRPPRPPPAARFRLATPLRIRQDGRYAGPETLSFRVFFGHLLRRISLLCHFYGEELGDVDFKNLLRLADGVRFRRAALSWLDLARYSSRQRTKVPMGGVVGGFEIGDDLGPFWPYLWLGQWTRVGKACTMGLGRYEIQLTGDSPS